MCDGRFFRPPGDGPTATLARLRLVPTVRIATSRLMFGADRGVVVGVGADRGVAVDVGADRGVAVGVGADRGVVVGVVARIGASRGVVALLVLLCAMCPVPVSAQGADKLQIEAMGQQISVAKPRGWVMGRPPRGSVALFQAAGDAASQIEIKATDGLQLEQHKSYSAAFHASLLKAGFRPSKLKQRAFASAAFPKAQTFTYEVSSDGREFAMIVWEAHAGEVTWQIIGFCPLEAWDAMLDPLAAAIAGFAPSSPTSSAP